MADPSRGGRAAPALDDTSLARQGGPDALSLALIDARNRTLRWLQRFEDVGRLAGGADHPAVPWWLAGRAGWFQEVWIARHVQRLRGEAADPQGPRLASIEPRADAWFSALPGPPAAAEAGVDLPDLATLRAYLAQTLEATLELLESAASTDEALHGFRVALLHEDRLAERMAVAAQWLQVDPLDAAAPCAAPPARRDREPLLVPPGPAHLGSPVAGCVPPSERGKERVDVPPLEIDAQAVSWARYGEFVADGGYDDRRWWGEDGWQWLQSSGRRAPRGVEQWRGAVVVQRHGRLQRAPAGQAVAHVSWYEARAWCRWAGRSLPLESQWVRGRSAVAGAFAWGDVWEWTASSARALEGAPAGRVAGWPEPGPDPSWRVLRGASSWTVPRAAHPGARRYAHPARDDLFCGFRSCAA